MCVGLQWLGAPASTWLCKDGELQDHFPRLKTWPPSPRQGSSLLARPPAQNEKAEDQLFQGSFSLLPPIKKKKSFFHVCDLRPFPLASWRDAPGDLSSWLLRETRLEPFWPLNWSVCEHFLVRYSISESLLRGGEVLNPGDCSVVLVLTSESVNLSHWVVRFHPPHQAGLQTCLCHGRAELRHHRGSETGSQTSPTHHQAPTAELPREAPWHPSPQQPDRRQDKKVIRADQRRKSPRSVSSLTPPVGVWVVLGWVVSPPLSSPSQNLRIWPHSETGLGFVDVKLVGTGWEAWCPSEKRRTNPGTETQGEWLCDDGAETGVAETGAAAGCLSVYSCAPSRASPRYVEKQSSTKPVPGARKVGDRCFRGSMALLMP